jgi:hypothetical protein
VSKRSFCEGLGIEWDGTELEIFSENTSDFQLRRRQAIERNKKIVTCPKCNITGGETNMLRWHFENCKVIIRYCKQCNKPIQRQNQKDYIYNKKIYCSNNCYNISKLGKCPIVMTEEVKKKISIASLNDGERRSERMKKVKPWLKSTRNSKNRYRSI